MEAGLRGERLSAEEVFENGAARGRQGLEEGGADDAVNHAEDTTTTTAQLEEGVVDTEDGTGDNTHPPRHGETFRATVTPQVQTPYTTQMAEQHIGDLVDDFAERSNAVGDVGHGAHIPIVQASTRGREDKAYREARKAEKKARKKGERQEGGGTRIGRVSAAVTQHFDDDMDLDGDELDMPVSATQEQGQKWRADGVGAQQANADLDAMDVDMPDVDALAAEIGAQRTTAAGLAGGVATQGNIDEKVVSQAEGMLSEQAEKDMEGEAETVEQRKARRKAKKEARLSRGDANVATMMKKEDETGGGFDIGNDASVVVKREKEMKKKRSRESDVL